MIVLIISFQIIFLSSITFLLNRVICSNKRLESKLKAENVRIERTLPLIFKKIVDRI